MGFRIKDGRELASAVVMALAGLAISLASVTYELGDAFNMGPGYFPLVLGVILVILSIITALSSLSFDSSHKAKPLRLKDEFNLQAVWAVVIVAGSFAGFAALLPVLGLALTCFLVLFLGAIGSGLLKPFAACVTAAVLSTASVVIFIILLGLQINIWPW